MKRKILILMIALLILPILMTLTPCLAQADSMELPETEWNQTYGGTSNDVARSVVQTGDGGYAIAGLTESFGAGFGHFWLVKTDADGNVEWNQTYGGTWGDWAYSVVQTGDGGYAIAGTTWSFGAGPSDSWLVKTDASGNMEWNQTYGGADRDWAYSMVETADGGYAIAGNTWSFGAGYYDCWLVKTDASGNMEWNQTYGGTEGDYAYSMVQTGDGGYAIAGSTRSFGAGYDDFWLVKTDADGNVEWNQTYGGTRDDYARSVVQTGDGGYAIAGTTGSFGAGGHDCWLVKTDASGNMEWNQTYGGTRYDYAYSMVQTGDGGYAVAGETESFGAGGHDCWLVKTDADGNVEWNQAYGGADWDWAYSVVQTGDGGYAVAGETKSFGAGGYDFWLIKLAPSVITATIDVDPDTLNLKSNGRWITCYIELPEEYNVNDIDVSSIMLNATVPVDINAPSHIGDCDGDGVSDLMVKFNKAEVVSIIEYALNIAGRGFSNVSFRITGKLLDEMPFEATDTIKLLFPGDVDGDGDVDYSDFIVFAGCYRTSIENPRYVQGADFNEDETIDYNDFIILAGNYGKTAT